MDNFESKQKEHYDKILLDYDKHYNDKYSRKYRQKFIYKALFADYDFKGKKVLEAMCGSGASTSHLKEQGAMVTGLDISPKAMDIFRQKFPDSEGLCVSMLDSGLADDSFDAIVIEGGLHHLHPHLNKGLDEIYRILKPGGWLFFMEPHSGSSFDKFRRLWYKRDKLFETNEKSIDFESVKKEFASKFVFEREAYIGGLAYIFVLSSMVMRIPSRLKFLYSDILIFLDKLIRPLIGKRSSFLMLGAWQKRPFYARI